MSNDQRIAIRSQRGAALVVGLVLLVVVTLLAISGMGTATMELRMAGNTQYRQNAFELAETGIERTLASGDFDTTGGPVTVGPVTVTHVTPAGTVAIGTYQSVTTCLGVTDAPPPHVFSLGSTISASHFTVASTGTADRGANAMHTQGFYVIGPAVSSIGGC